ncbi:hypothetical protein ACTZWY_01605 [Roseinatronobacter sp. NSM]
MFTENTVDADDNTQDDVDAAEDAAPQPGEAPDTLEGVFSSDAPDAGAQGTTAGPDYPVIENFNPDEDTLVIDLRAFGFDPENAPPVTLTGELAPDGEGLLVRADGVAVVQLSTYGGGDMQDALEWLDIDVVGAEYTFPSQDDPGLETDDDDAYDNRDIRLDYGGTDTQDVLIVVDSNPALGVDNPIGGGRAYGMDGDDTLIALKGDGQMFGPQVLDGVAGDNLIIIRSWAVAYSGTGADTFVLWPYDVFPDGDWRFDDPVQRYPEPSISNFDPRSDTLEIHLGKAYASLVPEGVQGSHLLGASLLDPAGTVEVVDFGNSAQIRFGGVALARIVYSDDMPFGEGISAADVRVTT